MGRFMTPTLVFLTLPFVFASGAASGHVHDIAGGAIVQLFEWSWDSVAAECRAFIGPAGYSAVQVSPPVEHIQGPEWSTSYQSVSYKLESRRGNRAQFAKMVSVCHAAGVKVIVDVVYNHMTLLESGVGVAGSPFTHYEYPGIYDYGDFHHCGLEPGDDIVNVTNRLEFQTCELVNLADLATETEHVRGRLAEYSNDLLSLGIDGLRVDLAKNIAANDIANILSRLTREQYVTQEVAWGPGESIQPSEYLPNGQVMEFRYTTALLNAFSSGNISSLRDLNNQGWIPGNQANVFVANHDTERMATSLNFSSPSNTYIMATIFSLAYPYGTPTILSSYSGFDNYSAGAPNNGSGTCSGASGTNGWLCQHRLTPIAGMVGFHSAVGSSNITGWVSPQSQQIAFGRGSTGFVAINNADTVWHLSTTTSIPGGTYCDVATGKKAHGSCTGSTIKVGRSRVLEIEVPPRNAVAIHTGARVS